MFVAQIILPPQKRGSDKAPRLDIPDRGLLENIFKYLHRNQHIAGDNYKYLLGFPQMDNTKNTTGRVLQVFSDDEKSLKIHLSSNKLIGLITDYCELSFHGLTKDILEKSEYYKIIRIRDEYNLPLSKIKRFIKRKSGAVYEMYLNEKMTAEEIQVRLRADFDKKRKDNNIIEKQFIEYKSGNSSDVKIFLDNQDTDSKTINIKNANSFGISKDCSIPKIIF